MNDPKPKRRRRWYQFSLRSLMLFMVVCAVGFGWLGRKLEEGSAQAGVARVVSIMNPMIVTNAGFLALSAVAVGLVWRQKPGTAFIIFSGLLVFALFLTLLVVCSESRDHMTLKEASEAGVSDDPSWIRREVFFNSVPGVWFLVFAGGIGLALSLQDHPDTVHRRRRTRPSHRRRRQ